MYEDSNVYSILFLHLAYAKCVRFNKLTWLSMCAFKNFNRAYNYYFLLKTTHNSVTLIRK